MISPKNSAAAASRCSAPPWPTSTAPERSASETDGSRPRAFYEESFDYSLFRRILVDPFRTAGSTGFVLAGFDEERDQVIHQPKWITAGADALLIIDGLFLNRRDLAGLWNYSIWLTVSQDVALARIAATGVDPDGELGQRAVGADALYQSDADPSEKASAIIDNTDPDHPRRVFADSC